MVERYTVCTVDLMVKNLLSLTLRCLFSILTFATPEKALLPYEYKFLCSFCTYISTFVLDWILTTGYKKKNLIHHFFSYCH